MTRRIEEVLEQQTAHWMAIPGVVGTAIGQQDGKQCVLVLTASDTRQLREKIPSAVEGYPVVLRHVGDIRALKEQ